jgi:hypothetical protein
VHLLDCELNTNAARIFCGWAKYALLSSCTGTRNSKLKRRVAHPSYSRLFTQSNRGCPILRVLCEGWDQQHSPSGHSRPPCQDRNPTSRTNPKLRQPRITPLSLAENYPP